MMKNNTRVVTNEVRLSYANIWEPRAAFAGQDEKYSVSVIIPKSDTRTIESIKKAIQHAIDSADGKSKLGNSPPANMKTPLRDGDLDRPDDEAYKNSYFVNANSLQAPEVVDAARQPIINRAEVYSGCYGRVSINFYPYNANGNRGIAAGLGNIQKLRDGEPLGGGVSAEEDFGAFEDSVEADPLFS